jgi:hypothetical protein
MFSNSPDATGHGFIFQLMHLLMVSESSNAQAVVSDLSDVSGLSLMICLMPFCMVLDPTIHLATASDPPDVLGHTAVLDPLYAPVGHDFRSPDAPGRGFRSN